LNQETDEEKRELIRDLGFRDRAKKVEKGFLGFFFRRERERIIRFCCPERVVFEPQGKRRNYIYIQPCYHEKYLHMSKNSDTL